MNCKNCGHRKSEHEDLHCNGIHYHKEMRQFEKLTHVEKRAKHQNILRLKKLNHGGKCSCTNFVKQMHDENHFSNKSMIRKDLLLD